MRKSLKLASVLLFTILSCAGVKKESPENWVEQTLDNMSLQQKIGQMMVIHYKPQFYPESSPFFNQLVGYVKQYHLGGVSLSTGEPYAVARTLNRLQKEAAIPLLVMADIEWGVSMRVAGGTTFPPNMAIGATRSEEHAYNMGKITARESRAIGIHVGFVPVLDVNNNPRNIIINTRSFGEDPDLVARLGSAYIRGLQENGVYATAKHYPGHGDTDVDSHLGLPVIEASRKRVENVELVPFRAAVDAGTKCIMVAHITFSSFPNMENRPATLDPYFIRERLRQEMGFDGLVISDAMDMGGIVNNYWSGEAAVMAINSGIDIILMTPNFATTYKFVLQAVEDGRIPQERIDQSVRRILQAKYDHGLIRKPQVDLDLIERVISAPEHRQMAGSMARESMTLIRDEKNIFPLHADELDTVLLLTITDGPYGLDYENRFLGEVRRRIPVVKSRLIDGRTCIEDIRETVSQADSVQAVIAGLFVRWGSYKGSVTFSDTTVQLLSELFSVSKPMAVISFGSPYLLEQVPFVPSYLCAFDTHPVTVEAGVEAVFGEIPVQGKLPVSIPRYADIGDGISKSAYRMELVRDIDDDILQEAYAVLDSAIADSVFPGAQIAIIRQGKLIASKGFGRQTYDPASRKITPETIYDLASVTKVAATTVVVMKLYEMKKIRLDIQVKSYLPDFSGGMKDSVTVRHLLTHSSGIRGWDKLWEHGTSREDAIDYIINLPLEYTPGDSMVYSDLGIILLGEIIRTVTGESIDVLASSMIYKPMGMENTFFNPPADLWSRIAPTEVGGNLDRGLIRGTVHDENAFFLNGIATHAGLFSTAEDLAALAEMLLNNGIYRHRRFLKPETIQEWTQSQNLPEGSDRALGWDTPSEKGSSAGDYFSDGSFGHLGFTGTSIWIDPNREIAVILLTNRVHPTRERGGIYQVRRKFHNAVMRALLQEMGIKIIQEEAVGNTKKNKLFDSN